MRKPKFKITASVENGKAVIRIDGYISDWSNYSAAFKAQLDNVIASGLTQADVYINSGGGDCFQANEIVNEIRRFKGTLNGYLGALCCSAASYIASNLDTVEAAPNTSYMFHKPSGQLEGNYDQIIATAKLLKNLQDDYAKAYAAKTGMPVTKIEEMWVNDYWMNSEEAKQLGFVNTISGQEADITEEEINALTASGYKNIPQITAKLNPQNNIMKELLITALALSAGAKDTEIVAKVEELKAKAAKADEYKTALDTANKKAKDEKINAELDKHQDKKRFAPEAREFWKKSLEADFDGTKAVLDKMPAATKLTDVIEEEGNGEDRSKWTYADYMDKNPKALQELAEKNPEKFEQLFNAHYKK